MKRAIKMFVNSFVNSKIAQHIGQSKGAKVLPGILGMTAAPALFVASLATTASPSSASPMAHPSAARLSAQPLSHQPLSQTKQSRRPRRSTRRPAVPRRMPPNRVQPGGGLDVSVNACLPESRPLTAIVPVENPVFTAIAHPTFLFYFPDDPAAVDYAEFILLSADEKEEIYSAQFTPTEYGIVSVSLPPDADKALEAGQAYHWYLNLHCQTTEGVPSVNGWVQRLADNSQDIPSADSQLPRLWYDAIAQTAAALTSPQSVISTGSAGNVDAQTQWNTFLSAAGLSELVDTPIVGNVVVEPRTRETENMSITEGL